MRAPPFTWIHILTPDTQICVCSKTNQHLLYLRDMPPEMNGRDILGILHIDPIANPLAISCFDLKHGSVQVQLESPSKEPRSEHDECVGVNVLRQLRCLYQPNSWHVRQCHDRL